jgi:hypothetical protein
MELETCYTIMEHTNLRATQLLLPNSLVLRMKIGIHYNQNKLYNLSVYQFLLF